MILRCLEVVVMLNKKFIILSIMLCCSSIMSVNAETLSELEFPKPPAYRVGISELPENQYVQAKQERTNIEKINKIGEDKDSSNTDITYADLSIKKLSKEIAQELEFDESEMVADLSLLWQGAAMQSDTINFALYKLANPDADKPDSKSVKKVLTTIASMSTLVGASMANPVFAGSSLIGGNILNIMSQDTKALNYKYTRVTDADMIILIRKIEDLQQNAVNLYYDYMSAKKQLDLVTKLVQDRKDKFELAQKNNAQRELIVITDAYYRTALDRLRSAKSEFYSRRAALEQFVGKETFAQFESELMARESGEKPVKSVESSTETNSAYSETIKNVENYTKNLNQETETQNKVPQISEQSNVDENMANSQDDTLQSSKENEIIQENITEENGIIPVADEISKNGGEIVEVVDEVKNSNEDNFYIAPLAPIDTNFEETKSQKSIRKSKDLLPLDEIKPLELDYNKNYSGPAPEIRGLSL